MNASEQAHPLHRYLPETLTSGSVTEGIGALGVIVLAILGLAGIFTNIVAPVATIVIGAVFLADSMLARSAISALNERGIRAGSGSGMTAGFFAGIAGIVLGILSFFHSAPVFVAVSLLVYGGALLLSGGTLARLNWLLTNPEGADSAAAAGGSGSAFMGLAVTVLGILAVIGLVPMTLSLVGLLCLGASAFFSGTSEAIQQHAH
ncbi:MAG TPA: hypothetical protein VMF08_05750 [Candidatus Sulfotelmatobacter sp.]|nr:hypothetical protein [Candidatus Sulfotelmatobacter sp.]